MTEATKEQWECTDCVVGKDCDPCERFYWKEVHADFCNEDCGSRTEYVGGQGYCGWDGAICFCEHCAEASKLQHRIPILVANKILEENEVN